MNDALALKAIAAKLKETNKFQSVQWGRMDKPLTNPTGGHAIIQRLSWTHDTRQGNMDTLERRTRFRIDLRFYHPNSTARAEKIVILEAVIFNTLNQSSLGGLVIPARTTVEGGTENVRDDLESGLSQVMIDGYFSYRVDPEGDLTIS